MLYSLIYLRSNWIMCIYLVSTNVNIFTIIFNKVDGVFSFNLVGFLCFFFFILLNHFEMALVSDEEEKELFHSNRIFDNIWSVYMWMINYLSGYFDNRLLNVFCLIDILEKKNQNIKSVKLSYILSKLLTFRAWNIQSHLCNFNYFFLFCFCFNSSVN